MPSINRQQILDALSNIKDPARGSSIVDLGMVHQVEIKDKAISITLAVPPLTKESKQALIQHCYEAVLQQFEADEPEINIHLLSEPPKNTAPAKKSIKNVLAVASGKGGVGKSTVAVNLACALKDKGYRVGLIDADLYGPSIPTMLGLKGQRPQMINVNGQKMIQPLECFGIHVMSIGFIIEPEQAVVLRGPRLSGVLKQFINDCNWPELDYLIIDLPPGTGDVQLTLVQSISVTAALIVTSPAQVAVDDALRAANMFRLDNINVPILGIVENMSWFTPQEFPDHQYYVFGKGGGERLKSLINVPLLTQIPMVMEAGQSNDEGQPMASDKEHPLYHYFSTLADGTIEKMAWRNTFERPTEQVKVN